MNREDQERRRWKEVEYWQTRRDLALARGDKTSATVADLAMGMCAAAIGYLRNPPKDHEA